MLGVVDHNPAILTVIIDRAKFHMALLDSEDNWQKVYSKFVGAQDSRTRVLFVVGVQLLQTMAASKEDFSSCKVIVFDSITNLLKLEEIEVIDAIHSDDSKVVEPHVLTMDGLNGCIDITTPGLNAGVKEEGSVNNMIPIFGSSLATEASPDNGASTKAQVDAKVDDPPKKRRGRPKREREVVEDLPLQKRRQFAGEGTVDSTTKKRRSRLGADNGESKTEAASDAPSESTANMVRKGARDRARDVTAARKDARQARKAAKLPIPIVAKPVTATASTQLTPSSFGGRIEAMVSQLDEALATEYRDAVILWTVGILRDVKYSKVRNSLVGQLDKRRLRGIENMTTGPYGNGLSDAFYDVSVFSTSVEEAAAYHKISAADLSYVIAKCPKMDKLKFLWKPALDFIKLRKKEARIAAKSA